MARGVVADVLSLCWFIDENESAVRRDLLEYGYALDAIGTDRGMCWADALAFVKHAPEGSAIATASLENPEDAVWTTDAQLLALIADGVRLQLWQNSGGSRADKPKPIERPGFRPEVKAIKGDVMSIEDISARLGIAPLF